MDEKEIFSRIVRIINHVLEEESAVTKENILIEDLLFDSVSLLYLQVSIEDEFDIRFDPLTDDFGSIFYNVDNLCIDISKKINGDENSGECVS